MEKTKKYSLNNLDFEAIKFETQQEWSISCIHITKMHIRNKQEINYFCIVYLSK